MTAVTFTTPETHRVLIDIANERERQIEKWGDQGAHLPDGTGPDVRPLLVQPPGFAANSPAWVLAERLKQACDAAHDAGTVTFAAILLEEVFEALTESDPAALRCELVQVAAVAVKWIEAIDRREVPNA